jgi:glucokinase
MSMSYYLGIEIGGTKLQIGVGPGDGTLAALWRGTVYPSDGADGIRRQITSAIPELLANSGIARAQLAGVGIGFGGPVDDATHSVIKSHQISRWDGFPLASWITEITDLPAILGNDADVAGLAEALFGAGKDLSPIFYMTIGSGIGGGLVINGEIYRGCGRGAAEIGHLRVDWPHPVALEDCASGWGIGQVAQWMLGQSWNAEQVADAARRGDGGARDVLDVSLKALAEGLCHVIALLCPRRIVIGGGVSLMGEDLLFKPLRELVAARVFKPFAQCYDIVPAALGEEVVVHGALALAQQRCSS